MFSSNSNIEISATKAWKILENEKNSFLVDVRTQIEWNDAGYPDLSSINKNLIMISWVLYPDMNTNTQFAEELISKINLKDKLFFICKTGVRSLSASLKMISLGYNCYNITHGLEGDMNSNNLRGLINGWKVDNLPWRQN